MGGHVARMGKMRNEFYNLPRNFNESVIVLFNSLPTILLIFVSRNPSLYKTSHRIKDSYRLGGVKTHVSYCHNGWERTVRVRW